MPAKSIASVCCAILATSFLASSLGCGGSPTSVPQTTLSQTGAQTFLVDFQQEQAGQIVINATASATAILTLGESVEEVNPQRAYLGPLNISVHSSSPYVGPSTGFRYAQVVMQSGNVGSLSFSVTPSHQQFPASNSFSSGDPLLDKIWQVSVRTAQLSVQNGVIFDAPKRDRDTFSGDTFITAKTLRAAFGHASDGIVEQTISDLAARDDRFCPGAVDVNCIPSYNGWWVIDLADLYNYNQDKRFLAAQQSNLLRILATMQTEIQNDLFSPAPDATVFADWSPGMVHFGGFPDAPEAVKIGSMVDYIAFVDAADLLNVLGDGIDANKYSTLADQIKNAVLQNYFDPTSRTFGPRVQTNAMAIYSGITSDPDVIENVYQAILIRNPSNPVSPYFNYFVISAMDRAGHREAAIQFIKDYWGSMLSTGATTFWEMYSPDCVNRSDFHSCLTSYANNFESDGNLLYVSLAHGWSSGPAPFMSGF